MASDLADQDRRRCHHRHRPGLRPQWAWACAIKEGKLVLLTGNQIGALMAWYRTKTMFELGWLNDSE